jgi:hypothetical protein
VADGALTAAGMPPDDRPAVFRGLIFVAVILPGVLWWFAPLLGRLRGLGWLIDDRPLSLSIDHGGFVLRQGSSELSRAWAEVTRMIVFEGSPPSAELVLRDGGRLKVPSELVFGRLADGRRTTLLDEVDRVQPALAQREARRHTARAISLAIVGVVAALGLIGLALVYLT